MKTPCRLAKLLFNSTYPKGGASCSKDSFVVQQSSVLRIKFSAENPAHRQSAKRQAVKKPHIAYNSPFKIASSPNFKHHIRHSFYAAYL